MSFVSIAQYNKLAYRQIFTLAQKVKGARHRTAAPRPMLIDNHILMLVQADYEPIADALSAKLKELGSKVEKRFYSSTSHESVFLEDPAFTAVFTVGCTHSATVEIASQCDAPVINVCSTKHSPVHVLSDILPVYEKRGFDFEDVSFCWHGFSENSAHSWLEAAHILGFKLSLVPTPMMQLDPDILALCQQRNRDKIFLNRSISSADVVINDTLEPDSKRLSFSRKVEDSFSSRGKGRDVTDAGLEFWDNELCVLIALMIWTQE